MIIHRQSQKNQAKPASLGCPPSANKNLDLELPPIPLTSKSDDRADSTRQRLNFQLFPCL